MDLNRCILSPLFQARLLKEDTDVPSTSSPPPPVTFASTAKPLRRNFYSMPRPSSATPEEKKEPKKPIFDNIRSSLLRPTAAFLVGVGFAGRGNASSTVSPSEIMGGVLTMPMRLSPSKRTLPTGRVLAAGVDSGQVQGEQGGRPQS